MEDDVGPVTTRTRREDQDSRGATGEHQQGEAEVCQGRRPEFLHGDISDREGGIEASATPLRTGRFKRDAYRLSVLSGGTDSVSHHEKYRLKDR